MPKNGLTFFSTFFVARDERTMFSVTSLSKKNVAFQYFHWPARLGEILFRIEYKS